MRVIPSNKIKIWILQDNHITPFFKRTAPLSLQNKLVNKINVVGALLWYFTNNWNTFYEPKTIELRLCLQLAFDTNNTSFKFAAIWVLNSINWHCFSIHQICGFTIITIKTKQWKRILFIYCEFWQSMRAAYTVLSYTLSNHIYKQKTIVKVHWIPNIFYIYYRPNTSDIQ